MIQVKIVGFNLIQLFFRTEGNSETYGEQHTPGQAGVRDLNLPLSFS